MKQSKFGKAIAKALALAMTLSLFTVMPAAQAADTETNATISAYDSTNSLIKENCTSISEAISLAGKGGTVKIGEGTIALNSGIYIQQSAPPFSTDESDGVTIEGAGIDMTYIKPQNANDFVEHAGEDEYEYLFQVYGNYITIKNMTIDASSIPDSESGGCSIGKKTLDFVPLRLTGGEYGEDKPAGNVTIENLKILRNNGEGSKGCIQIGTNIDTNNSQSKCNVTAINVFMDGNTVGSQYATVEVCAGSTLTINGGAFNGTINLPQNDPNALIINGEGYYKIESNYAYFCTTIPYIVDCYDTVSGNEDMVAYILNKLSDTTIDSINGIQKMADDLADPNIQLYGYTCDEKRELANDFNNVLININRNYNDKVTADLSTPIDTLNDALKKDDWHNWGDDNTCDVCGAKRATVTNPNTQCVPRTDSTTGDPDGSNLYGVRFVFEYNAGDTGAASVNNYGAYVLDTSVFDNESSSDKTKLEYADDTLASGETFTVDVIDIPANTTVYAVPFADGVFGSIVSTTTDAAAASAGSLE